MKKAGTVRFSLLLSWPPLGGGSRRSKLEMQQIL